MRDKADRTLFQLIEHIPHVFWVFDPRSVEILYVSRAYELIWGRSRSSLYRRPLSFLDAVHPQDRARVHAMLEKQLRFQSIVEQFRIVRNCGEVRWVRHRSFPMKNGPEGIVYLAGIVEDITDSRGARPIVRHKPNIAALEHLAGAVAHDFNNILTAVMGNADFLLKDQSLSREAQRRAEVMLQAAVLGKSLAKELTEISQHLTGQVVNLDLNVVIRGLVESFSCLVGREIELTTVLASDLVSVRANPEQLTGVLMNLVLNARDAMPSGGRITVSTHNAEKPGWATRKRTYFSQPKQYAALEIADNGCGMDSATQAHIFKPFFTTKSCGAGTGLGLYHAKRIVGEWGGRISVSSAIGEGTKFTLFFPEGTVRAQSSGFSKVSGIGGVQKGDGREGLGPSEQAIAV